MQIKQFQFGTQNETKTSIFYISGKVLGASPTRSIPKYPAMRSLSLSFSGSRAKQLRLAEGKIIISAYLHAALVLAVQLTDGLTDRRINGLTATPSPAPCLTHLLHIEIAGKQF